MNLPRLSEPIDFCYDRTKSEIGIVHLGIGAFHRAHQAVYTDKVLDRFGGDWAICGVSLRSPEMRDALVPQNGLYPLLERSGSENHVRIIGSVKEVLFALKNDMQTERTRRFLTVGDLYPWFQGKPIQRPRTQNKCPG